MIYSFIINNLMKTILLLLAIIHLSCSSLISPTNFYTPLLNQNSTTVCQTIASTIGATFCPLNLYGGLLNETYLLNTNTYNEFVKFTYSGPNPNGSKGTIVKEVICPKYTFPSYPKNVTYSGNNFDITNYKDPRLCQEIDSSGLQIRVCVNGLDPNCAIAGVSTSKNFPGKTCCPY